MCNRSREPAGSAATTRSLLGEHIGHTLNAERYPCGTTLRAGERPSARALAPCECMGILWFHHFSGEAGDTRTPGVHHGIRPIDR